ncbi:MAG: hypothetical protein JWR85_4215 [Marmoricola sp.]|nr:hypothetical protein [Marmoricola sp.]
MANPIPAKAIVVPPEQALQRAKFAMEMRNWHWKSEASDDLQRDAHSAVCNALGSIALGRMKAPFTQEELQAMYDIACTYYPDSYDAFQGYVQALCDIGDRLGFEVDRQAEYERESRNESQTTDVARTANPRIGRSTRPMR